MFLAGVATMILIFGASGAADDATTRELVLSNGTRLAVGAAELRGTQVIVTFPNGSLMSYAADDVDLEASGLVTTDEAAAEEAGPPPVARPASLHDAKADEGEAKLKITDLDVDHIDPEGPVDDEEIDAEVRGIAEVENSGPLQATGARYWLVGDKLNVSGAVKNTGSEMVSAIRVRAVAMGPNRKEVGSGSSEVRGPLNPGMSARFRITFDVKGEPSGVRVRLGGGGPRSDAMSARPRPTPRERSRVPNPIRPFG
jgi:hypothetical protein